MNVAYLASAQSCIKILQIFLSIATCILLCGDWNSSDTCFRSLELTISAGICVLAVLINISLFVLNLKSTMTTKLEAIISGISAAILFCPIFLISLYETEMFQHPFSFQNATFFALVFTSINAALFSYTTMVLWFSPVEMTQAASGPRPAGSNVPSFKFPKLKVRIASLEDRPRTAVAASSRSTLNKGEPTKDYEAEDFQHKGALKIQRRPNFEMTPLINNKQEEEELPQDAQLTFTDHNNIIYDIGSEVEEIVD